MTKKEALYMLREAVALPRMKGRIETIREAFELYEKALKMPWWKRLLNGIRK